MKILAIRGKNLASLSAVFEIDFQQEPLRSAGLYAITGPTGSGKSTLLDALCLALYERTPRLTKAVAKGESIPDVGDNAVTPSDVRTMLRRGAGEGFAEVDFEGGDGVPYRARWSVRRARNKADGKLQASDISLTRMADGQRLGDHTKSATLALIEERVGLNFEQFTRAVLLAQNDFATFLKAPDDERAELLQTLTGTEMFSDISRQAYARMKSESDKLEQLKARLQDQQPLEAVVRSQKLAELDAQSAGAKLLEVQKATVESQLRWIQQHEQLLANVQDAEAQCQQADAAIQAALPRQQHLQRLEQVQAAQPMWAECQRLTQAEAAALQQQTRAAVARSEAQTQFENSQTAYQTAEQQAADAKQAQSQAQADINTARGLDASIATLQPQCQTAENAQAEAQQQHRLALAAHAQTGQDLQQAQLDLKKSQDWLDGKKTQLQTLADGWQRWDTLLAQAEALQSNQQQLKAQQAELASQEQANAQAGSAAQARLKQATEQVDQANQTLHLATQALAAINTEQLAGEKTAHEQQHQQIQAALFLWQRRSDALALQNNLQAQQQEQAATLAHSQTALQDCAHQQPLQQAALEAAERALQQAQLAASAGAEAMRAQLQPQQPCPVCGALEHPYASHSPVVDALLQTLKDGVASSKKALRHTENRAAEANANYLSATKALASLAKDLAAHAGQQASLQNEWTALPLHTELDELDALPELDQQPWLQARQNAVQQTLARISQQEATQRKLQKDQERAQTSANTAALALQEARQDHSSLAAISVRLQADMGAVKRQLTEMETQLEATLAPLDAAFPAPISGENWRENWRERWSKSPQPFKAQCQQLVSQWHQQQKNCAELVRKTEQLAMQLAAKQSACDQASQLCTTRTQEFSKLDASLKGLQQQRRQLFGGRPLAEVEAGLAQAINKAQAAWAQAQSNREQSSAERSRCEESQRQASRLLEQHRANKQQAQESLDGWLLSFNTQQRQSGESAELTRTQLQQLLGIAQDWIGKERSALQALHSAVTAAQAVLQTRQQSLAEHQTGQNSGQTSAETSGQNSAQTKETLQAQLQAVQQQLQTQLARINSLQVEIAQDNQRLQASAALRQQIEQQAAVAKVWSQLGELIGSADGKKFRNFAQQLTLDVLLGYGNRHLQGLSRRYLLQRIKNSLGLLVVDQDMGDELRSVHSLSGGESFLVSLALALGLASLSSHRVRVESLFIDEGFGSLDADSLRLAMDALDTLQGQGRKVGVISHVQEMTERIGTRIQVLRQGSGMSRVVVG